jgi:hypothetical protein
MKKLFVLSLVVIVCVSMFSFMTLAYADSEELLLNGGFESGTADYWGPSVAGTVEVYESYGSITPKSGSYFLVHEGRYSAGDAPVQFVQDKVKANGPGLYRISAYVRLTDDATVDSVPANAVIMTTSDEGNNWFGSTEYPTINKTDWTLVQSEVELTWSGDLSGCNFYFVTQQDDAEAQTTHLAIDDASLVKVVAEETQPAEEESTPAPETGDLSVLPYILTAGIAFAGTKFAVRKIK